MQARALIELLRGRGAHADPIACIEDLSADVATLRIEGFPHSIDQLVFHMNYWMSYDLKRIRGERPPYPKHNSESFPALRSADAEDWDGLKNQFALLLNDSTALANGSRQELDRQIEPTHEGHKKLAGTLEAVLWQLAVHNSYHIGQIAMIRRSQGAWPPRLGGDSW
jgi:uncharacterized damage-inducible protein DinB